MFFNLPRLVSIDLEQFGDPSWDQSWDPIGPRGAKMGPRIQSFKVPKSCICKNLETQYVFEGFWMFKVFQKSV